MLNLPTISRRHFSRSLASLLPAVGFPALASSSNAAVPDTQGISHSAEAIHQEVVIKANRKRVYEVLTDTEQFRKLSGGMDTKISREPGGTFSLFGGVITGRHIELVPGERIVQAWRSEWAPGDYSIARFVLKEQGSDTKIVFDHTGFPPGKAEHLASGWKAHYWDGLAQYFAS
jgi:activator of HSP90 ATPase